MSIESKPVFISYRSTDGSETARELKGVLWDSAYDAYLDVDDLGAGEWSEQLREAIEACEVFIPVITEEYIERLCSKKIEMEVIQKEFCAAMDHPDKIKIIPFFTNEELKKKSGEIVVGRAGERTVGAYQWADNNSYLLRLVSDKLPTAMMKACEESSAQSITAWRSAQTGLLYDPDMTIHRRTDAGDGETEYSVAQIRNLLGKHRAICFAGDGGCGKTFLLQRIFDDLHADCHFIPIYVKLSGVSFDDRKENPILSHILKPFPAGEEQFIRELHKENAPAVVFLLDGLNEVSGRQLEAEKAVNALTEKCDTARVIMTTRYLPSGLADKFAAVKICDLDDDDIREYLGEGAPQIEKGSILRLPLYLRLYKLSLQNQSDRRPDPKSKREILYEVFVRHPVDRFGDALTDELRAAYAYLLPFICFRMANRKKVTVTEFELIDDVNCCLNRLPTGKGAAALLEKCFGFVRGITLEELRGANLTLLIQAITEQLFPAAETAATGEEEQYRICHQDIRDFFAAHYLKSATSLARRLAETDEPELFRFTLEAFNHKTFDPDAEPMLLESLGTDLAMSLEQYERREAVVRSLIRIRYFLANRAIEGAHNGTVEKRRNCEKFRECLDSTRDYLIRNHEKYYDPSDIAFGRLILLDAEVYRRLEEYDRSMELSREFLERLRDVPEDQRQWARHNIAKCAICRGLDLAKQAKGNWSADADALYTEAFEQLKQNTLFDLSANLYAMLLVNPDPVSKPYTDRAFGLDSAERRFRAFKIVEKAFRSSAVVDGKIDPASDSWYSLQTMLSYLLHGNVRLTGFDDEGFPITAQTAGEDCWDIRENKDQVLSVARRYIDLLSTHASSSAVACFDGLVLLQDPSSFEKAMERFKRSFQQVQKEENMMIGGSILGCLVYTILAPDLTDEARDALLTMIQDTLNDRITAHDVDSFDAVYILADIRSAWRGLKDAASCRMDEEMKRRTDCELQILSDKCRKEEAEWNPA